MMKNHKIIVRFQRYRYDGECHVEIDPDDPEDVIAKVKELVGNPLLYVAVVPKDKADRMRTPL